MIEAVAVAGLAVALLTLVLVGLIWLRLPPAPSEPLTTSVLLRMLREETEAVRRAGEEQARGLRHDLAEGSRGAQETLARSFGALGETVAAQVRGLDERLDAAAAQQEAAARALREEVSASLHRMGGAMAATLSEMGEAQRERLEATGAALAALSERHERSSEALKGTVEGRLDALRGENAAKLDEMRRTVDERLQSTLETRLGESFARVVEQLNRVHEGLGEMKSLAANVGDLKNVLVNVRVRGTFGEVQLAGLLEQFLTREQYVTNARVREHSGEHVEFAVRMPGADEPVLLPIDAKFPREAYDRLIEAARLGDEEGVRAHRRQLEAQVRSSARDIREKYVNPPVTTDFAVLFLPTEGLYAEVLRAPGLFEAVQREHRVTIAGPTTLAALLNALQMGFRSLAIERRSGEVWRVLGAVRTEFGKYNEVVQRLGNQLATAARSVDSLGVRTRAMDRRLRAVEAVPEGAATGAALGFEGEEAAPEPVLASSGEPVERIGPADAVAGTA